MTLLEKTRTLNKLLQKVTGHSLNFTEMAELLRDLIESDIYVLSRRGKFLGYAVTSPFQSNELHHMVVKDRRIPDETQQLLAAIESTQANIAGAGIPSGAAEAIRRTFEDSYISIVPIIGGTNRLGTLVLSRPDREFNDDDLILAEYGSTILGMEITRIKEDESETEARSRAIVQVAVGSLSFSELEAVEHIFEELDGKEGLLVASKIADRVGITRSVIVNALRKLESAGVIETRSLGMKGTFIKILNAKLVQELEKARA